MTRPSADRCAQEMCPNWSGDGEVCPCALFDLPRNCDHSDNHDPDKCEQCGEWLW